MRFQLEDASLRTLVTSVIPNGAGALNYNAIKTPDRSFNGFCSGDGEICRVSKQRDVPAW